uniref:Uncharacterized protein n=1 Tax=Triticum urartu TaxID=4572 RepID=A0A8R7V2I9_TRIUA
MISRRTVRGKKLTRRRKNMIRMRRGRRTTKMKMRGRKMTGSRRWSSGTPCRESRIQLRSPDIFDPDVNGATYWGTVLCAADGCNHAACNLGPFFVALIGLDSCRPYDDDDKRLRALVYSSETREWTSTATIHIGGVGRFEDYIIGRPSVFVGQALHFLLHGDPTVANIFILKYDFHRHRLSVIDLPELCASSWTPPPHLGG